MQKEQTRTENEKKKEYLRSYKDAVKAVGIIEDEINQLRLDKMCPTVINDGMPHSSNNSDLSGYAASLDELETKLIKARYRRIEVYSEIIGKIEAMEIEREKCVLRLKYIHCLTWEEVAVRMGYGWRQMHNIHGEALTNFSL